MILCEEPDFANLPPDSAALFAAAAETSFFSQAAWYDLIARHAPEPGTRLRLYLDAAPARAAIVCRADAGTLHSLTNAYSVEHGPILGAERGAEAVAGLAAEIALESPHWETIGLSGLDPAAPGFAAIANGLGRAHWLVRPVFDSGTWYEETSGLDFRSYLDARPAALKNTFRRKAKSAAAHRIDYAFSDEDGDIERLIDDYETVYRNSWKKFEPFPTFMPALIRLAHGQGALRLGIVRIDGVPATAQFWILWRGRAVIYKLAYDERYAQLSLGTLLTMRMIERVLERDRPSEINFGRGDDDYKRMWLPKRRERWGLIGANPRTFKGLQRGFRLVAARLRDRVLARPRP